MQKRKFKKVMAGMLATMLLTSTLTVSAEEVTTATGGDSSTGTGEFEGYVEATYAKVSLPTVAEGTYDYLIDPNGLIAATGGEKYEGVAFEEGKKLFFKNSATSYTSASNKAKIVNLGTDAIDVTVTAKATNLHANVEMATAEDFTGATGAAIFMQLNVDTNVESATDSNITETSAVVDTAGTTGKVVVGLAGNMDNFEIVYDATANENAGAYKFEQISGVSADNFNSFEFWLTGACNADDEWESADMTAGGVEVTWEFAAREDDSVNPMLEPNAVEYAAEAAPSIAVTEYTMVADTEIEINVDLGRGDLAATAVTSVTYNGNEFLNKNMTYADGVITVSASAVNALMSKEAPTLIVTFDDEAGTTETITFTK